MIEVQVRQPHLPREWQAGDEVWETLGLRHLAASYPKWRGPWREERVVRAVVTGVAEPDRWGDSAVFIRREGVEHDMRVSRRWLSPTATTPCEAVCAAYGIR